MNNPVDAARKRLAAIEEEAEKLRLFIAAYEIVADYIGIQVEAPTYRDSSVDKSEEVAGKFAAKRPRAVNPPTAVLIPAVMDILKQRGHPLSRRGIYQALKERDLVIQGADPVKALGTILWRNQDQFIQLDGYGYWMKNVPYSRANYLPEQRPSERAQPMDDPFG